MRIQVSNPDKRMSLARSYPQIDTSDLICDYYGCMFSKKPNPIVFPIGHDVCFAWNEAKRRVRKRERTLANLRENANVFVPWGQRA